MGEPAGTVSKSDVIRYWEENVHDHKVIKLDEGTDDYFRELAEYRYTKSRYLKQLVSGLDLRNRVVLEIGTGTGIDLMNMKSGWSNFQAIDLSYESLKIAKQGMRMKDLGVDLLVMDGERVAYPDESFDLIYAHSVLQYTPDDVMMVSEVYRLLKQGGEALLAVFHTNSWLWFLSRTLGMKLEHQESPVFRTYTVDEFKALLSIFKESEISVERFPVETRLYGGYKATLYNRLFVPIFKLLPEEFVKNLGWHLVGLVRK
jgi:ubiquinone/menaquinone biosynthesis C-methylase UbiE